MKKHILITFILSTAASATHASHLAEFTSEQDGVSITVRPLDKNAHPVMAKRFMRGYQAIEIELQNKESNSFVLTKGNFGLKVVSHEQIVQKISSLSIPYRIFFGCLGFIAGAFVGATIGVKPGSPFSGIIEAFFLGIAGAIGGVIAGGRLSKKHHRRVINKTVEQRKELSRVASDLQEPLKIPANSTVKTVFYIHKNKFRAQFKITLQRSGAQ